MKYNYQPIPDYEGLYEISNKGIIKRLSRTVRRRNGVIYTVKEKIVKTSLTQYGYLSVRLNNTNTAKSYLLHRLVALTFIPNPHGHPNVLHADDNPLNNNLNNLRWGTQSDNMKDRVKNGYIPSLGTKEKLSRNQKTEKTIINKKTFKGFIIGPDRKRYASSRAAGEITGMSPSTIRWLVRNNRNGWYRENLNDK